MPGQYEKPITVLQAIHAINARDYLLPAIQRKFVWNSQQICVLFDSIMRGYPINSFMLWEVSESQIKNNYKFYEFLKTYCQRFNEENSLLQTSATTKDFKAIIDGQQRLTSLYIGLNGTYAYKTPRKRWPKSQDDEVLPPRKLYLDLKQPMDSESDESLMKYNFKFLTDKQVHSDDKHHWFCLHDLMKFDQVEEKEQIRPNILNSYLKSEGIDSNDFAVETLEQLYEMTRINPIVHFYQETSQEIDHVLDVFIRTNSGGTKLDFADLLMSIAVAHWNGDFRHEIENLTKDIHLSDEMGFYLERDWVLKACLVLTGADVRFKVKNFHKEQVETIQNQWPEIKACIKATLKLVRRIGINPQSLTSKNAVIPICYYLYKKKDHNGQALFKAINDMAKHSKQRNVISQWLYMALLKGVFSGQADTIIKNMRDVLNDHLDEEVFPIQHIIDRFINTNKDLRFDDEYIDYLLDTQYGEARCRPLLHLLFPELDFFEAFDLDHLHAKSLFEPEKLEKLNFLKGDDKKMAFYQDKKHWNSVVNLHLLNSSQNKNKKAMSLKDWLESAEYQINRKNLLVEEVDLDFDSFESFYHKRRLALKKRLESRVYRLKVVTDDALIDEDDEQVVEDVEV